MQGSEEQRCKRDALIRDPNFASAHLLLAYSLWNTGQPAEATPYFKRALDLSDNASERERLFIIASYDHHVLNDQVMTAEQQRAQLGKTAEAYENLLRLYPDHYWGTSNLIGIYRDSGRPEDAAGTAVHLSELRPGNLRVAARVLNELAVLVLFSKVDRTSIPDPSSQRVAAAQAFAARANALLSPDRESASPGDAALLRSALATEQWIIGNSAEAASQLTFAIHEHQPGLDNEQIGTMALTMGRLNDAQTLYNEHPDPVLLAYVASYRGDHESAKQHLKEVSRSTTVPAWWLDLAASLDVREGLLPEAREAYGKFAAIPNADDRDDVVKGELAIAEHRPAEGTKVLEQSLPNADLTNAATLVACEVLAGSYESQKRFADAARILQVCTRTPGSPFNRSESYSLRLSVKLADVYRELGRLSDAEKVEADLRKELMFADPDHPIVVALKKREQPENAIARK